MGDIKLFNLNMGTDINIEDGDLVMDNGIHNAVLLSLFSGPKNAYWGNSLHTDEAYHFGGEFETATAGTVFSHQAANLLSEAIKRDLSWMKRENIAQEITVSAHIDEIDFVTFQIIIIRPDGDKVSVKFDHNWNNQTNGV